MTTKISTVIQLPDMAKQTINLSRLFYTKRTMELVHAAIRDDMDAGRTAHDSVALARVHAAEEFIDLAVAGSSLSKRVSNWLFKDYQVRLSNEVCGRIGEIAAAAKGFTCDVDVTNAFDWNDGDFGDAGSCFFGGREYNSARCEYLPRLHASAMRFYRNDRGHGRTWVIPVPNRVTGGRQMYMMTNYYGDNMTPQRCAIVLAKLLGQTYGGEWASKSVHLEMRLPFYVNPAANYILYPADQSAESVPNSFQIRHEDLDDEMNLPEWALIGLMSSDDSDDYDDDEPY